MSGGENTNNQAWWEKVKQNKKDQPLVFIHTPKCGGTYASSVLGDLGIKNKHQTKKHRQAVKDEGITFTIIREPIARFESLMNYRLAEDQPRKDWPADLKYAYLDETVTLNEVVNKMTDEQITGFAPYRSLDYWVKNVDICITIDKLQSFLAHFGYVYSPDAYEKQNVSKKTRGKFNDEVKARLSNSYEKDISIYNTKILNCDTESKETFKEEEL